jgi:hypothetical protein
MPNLAVKRVWDFLNLISIYKRHNFKSKRICNPQGNGLRRFSKDVTISEDGLIASNNTTGWKYIFAEKGFPISVANCRTDGFPGTICYYYEVKSLSKGCVILFIIIDLLFIEKSKIPLLSPAGITT